MDTRTDTPKEVAEHLKHYLRQLGSLKDAAATLGVGPTTLSNQLNGKSYFTRKNATRYAGAFGVNADYLVTGRGEIHPDYNVPKNVFPMYTQNERTSNSVEERITIGVRAQLEKLEEIGHTYNNLVEHIVETAGLLMPGAKDYEFCQKVIERLNGVKVPSVLDLLIK